MTDKNAAKARTELLKGLREQYRDSVAATQALLKEQQAARKQVRLALTDGPKTVPQIAQVCDFPTDRVLWHVIAMKKYDEVVETGMDGEYYQYQLASEIQV